MFTHFFSLFLFFPSPIHIWRGLGRDHLLTSLIFWFQMVQIALLKIRLAIVYLLYMSFLYECNCLVVYFKFFHLSMCSISIAFLSASDVLALIKVLLVKICSAHEHPFQNSALLICVFLIYYNVLWWECTWPVGIICFYCSSSFLCSGWITTSFHSSGIFPVCQICWKSFLRLSTILCQECLRNSVMMEFFLHILLFLRVFIITRISCFI